MITEIFDIIYQFLKWISIQTGFTYREVNIIVYFMIIPSLFIYLFSRIIKNKYPIIVFLVFVLFLCIGIPDFEIFSNKLFDHSVDFLNWFELFGLNYIQASVVICVVIPVLVIILLLYLNKKKKDHLN